MSLSYQTTGNTSDTPLLFLHGLGAGSSQIISGLRHLPNSFLITPDMPGHGESQGFAPEDLTFNQFADLVIELMDQLGLESTNIGGLSMGSGITLNLALRYPKRVKKTILLRPSWLDQKEPEHLKLVAYVGQWIEEGGIEHAREKLAADLDFQKINAENKPVAESIQALFQRPTTAVSTAVLYKMWQDCPFSDLSQLSSLPNHSLVLTTGRDELHPQSVADSIAAHLPSVQSAELPPRYHQPEDYALALSNIVNEFLSE